MISVMFMQDHMNRRRLEIILGLGKHLRLWHGNQSATLRENDEALTWVKSQVGEKDFFKHVNAVISSLSSDPFLVESGFCIPGKSAIPDENTIMVEDDELATVAGSLAVSFASARIRISILVLKLHHKLHHTSKCFAYVFTIRTALPA